MLQNTLHYFQYLASLLVSFHIIPLPLSMSECVISMFILVLFQFFIFVLWKNE